MITWHLERHGLTVVTLRGDHDLSSKRRLDETLARAGRVCDVVVDLSECTFMETTVMTALRTAHRNQGARGLRLALFVPPQATAVSRFVGLAGLGEWLPIHAKRSAALAPATAVSGGPRAEPTLARRSRTTACELPDAHAVVLGLDADSSDIAASRGVLRQ